MKNILILIFLALIISCSPKKTDNDAEAIIVKESSEKVITITDEQIKLAGIETGKLVDQVISETITCSGKVEVPPKNIASVSPTIGGFIKTINYFPGDFVEKGAVLANLQHPDFIQLQQQYLEAKSQADYYQQEYKRQGELTVENAASIKKMQKAKADFLHFEATSKSLQAQLELIGINTSEIVDGNFIKEFKLLAPISGTISQLNANKGKYVNSEDLVFEIINDHSLNLHFNVFEKDILKIKPGQNINFSSLNNSETYVSKVKRVGIKLNEQNRTIMVYGKFNNENRILKPGMYINASILINERKAHVLPSEAIVDYEGESCIFVKKENNFQIVKVEKGIEYNNMIEIKGNVNQLSNKEIVIKGCYYLLSKLEVEE